MLNLFYFFHLFVAIGGTVAIFWLSGNGRLHGRIFPNRVLAFLALPIALAGWFLFTGLSFWATWPPASGWDFLNAYYPAGRAVLTDTKALNALLKEGTIGFVNLPIVACLFAPLALLPTKLSIIVFSLIGLLSVLLSWRFLVRLARLERREQWLLFLLFIVNGPLISGFKYGNLSYFLLLALTGGLLLLKSERSGYAGLVLGVATVIKPPLAVFGFFFLFRRDWRAVATYVGTGLAAIAASLLVFGWEINSFWFEMSVVQYSHTWLDAFNVQSITAFIQRLTDGNGLREWKFATTPSWLERIAVQLISGLLLLIAALACLRQRVPAHALDTRMREKRLDLQYLLVICVSLVASPLSWTHYYVWLLVPIAFFLSWNAQDIPRWSFWLGWSAILMVTPLAGNAWSLSNPFLMTLYRTLIVSHYLWGGVLIFALVSWQLARTGGLLWTGVKSHPENC